MPTSKSSNWFVTISTRSRDDVDFGVVESLSTSYRQFYVVEEHGVDSTHSHVHCALWGDLVETQDCVRKRWIRQLDVADQPRAVVIKPIVDGNRLIGEYLCKEAGVIVLHSNLSDELLTTLREAYAKVAKVKGKPKKHLVISNLADEIINFAKGHGMALDSRTDCVRVVSKMYQMGYRFISGLSRMKFIWSEIQMISGQTIEDSDIFGFV